MILDTNALSALLDGDEALVGILWEVDRQTIPSVVLGEYRFGIMRSRFRKKMEKVLDQLEAESNVLPVDAGTARFYAQTRHRLRQKGTPIPENDIWIAALSLQHKLPLVSRDEHFEQVPGITRISW